MNSAHSTRTVTPGRTAGSVEGTLVVDHAGCIRFSSGTADALIGRRSLDSCRSVFELFAPDSRDELQRLLQDALSGTAPAPGYAHLRLASRESHILRLRALPLLGKTSGRPVAAALEIGNSLEDADGGAVFCRADLLTDAHELCHRLERALVHHRTTGVEYLLCGVWTTDGEQTPWTALLDRLLMSLRAGDVVAATRPGEVWLLLSGCGAAQLSGIHAKLMHVLGDAAPLPRVGAAPVTCGATSAQEWLAAATPERESRTEPAPEPVPALRQVDLV